MPSHRFVMFSLMNLKMWMLMVWMPLSKMDNSHTCFAFQNRIFEGLFQQGSSHCTPYKRLRYRSVENYVPAWVMVRRFVRASSAEWPRFVAICQLDLWPAHRKPWARTYTFSLPAGATVHCKYPSLIIKILHFLMAQRESKSYGCTHCWNALNFWYPV